ncbi:MAG: hypothetical protein KGZ80_06850 [Methylomonas sp.]|nr:hypothetical protein [Methylomonas sp.]PPD25732.1 MAG: hypothetical protein CTY22_07520 [Methylomonas sp.]PPD36985.1 MAG: hypothetical protein CTY21_07520 [Methylomonas sp.]PPD39112.1 MAG: hypothetical protein CTY17_08455 [Methylomonas sp.]PPD55611.1 MAG: hypothetical protein CTY11_01100 [Methylomonas sp.]
MSKTLVVKIRQTPDALFAKAQKAAVEQGYQLVGDASHGTISGASVKASYKFSGHHAIILTIQDKPALLSWQAVEQRLLSFLTE